MKWLHEIRLIFARTFTLLREAEMNEGILRSLGARPSQPKRLLRRSRQGGYASARSPKALADGSEGSARRSAVEGATAVKPWGSTFFLGRLRKKDFCGGFTLVELMIAMLILGTLAAIAIPAYGSFVEKANIAKAIADIRNLEEAISAEIALTGTLPDALTDLPITLFLDPWGNTYQYANYALIAPGLRRKDQFLVPVNSDYDLYSMGRDGASQPPFTANVSKDDIVRANDGRYLGLAENY